MVKISNFRPGESPGTPVSRLATPFESQQMADRLVLTAQNTKSAPARSPQTTLDGRSRHTMTLATAKAAKAMKKTVTARVCEFKSWPPPASRSTGLG